MDAVHLMRTTDAAPSFGLFFYCPAVADAAMALPYSAAIPITDVKASFGLSSYSPAAVMAVLSDADANQ